MVERDLQLLIGIIEGISCDKKITEDEDNGLFEWIKSKQSYQYKEPYKGIYAVIMESLADGILTLEESQNIIWHCKQYVQKDNYYNELTSGLQRLYGIVKGISIDREVTIEEIEYLTKWMDKHTRLKGSWPFDELYNLVIRMVQDKQITHDEQKEFLAFYNAFINDSPDSSSADMVEALQGGYCQIDPEIKVAENTFCITGISSRYKRKEIAERIELFGGYVSNTLTSKVNYLVVCDEKNACWAFTCYGRKVEQAINWRKKGVSMAIVHEFDLYDAFEDLV
ncbi:MAG: BRCT domain-containing protein [Bacteroidetes bacterium]|nr:BRCT domain-containing protein [Bacteroidota bacterium]